MAFRTTPKNLVWRATAAANLASYLCLALLFWTAMGFFRNVHFGSTFFEPIINWFLEIVFRAAGSFAAK
jgi:hypothetical protein